MSIDIGQYITSLQDHQQQDDLNSILNCIYLGQMMGKSQNVPQAAALIIQKIKTCDQQIRSGEITRQQKIQLYDQEINKKETQPLKMEIKEKEQQEIFKVEENGPQSIIISQGLPSQRNNTIKQVEEQLQVSGENKLQQNGNNQQGQWVLAQQLEAKIPSSKPFVQEPAQIQGKVEDQYLIGYTQVQGIQKQNSTQQMQYVEKSQQQYPYQYEKQKDLQFIEDTQFQYPQPPQFIHKNHQSQQLEENQNQIQFKIQQPPPQASQKIEKDKEHQQLEIQKNKLKQPNFFKEQQQFQTQKLAQQYIQQEFENQVNQNQFLQQQQQHPNQFQNNQNHSFLDYVQKENLKQCKKCFLFIELEFGCNHIICTCGHQFCYNCGRDWVGQECRCLGIEEMLPEVRILVIQPEIHVQQNQKKKMKPRDKMHREVNNAVQKAIKWLKKQ